MNAPNSLGVGIIGCGVISGAYARAAQMFPQFHIKSVADIDPSAAAAKAEEFGVAANSVEGLLADPEISIVLNLTIPIAHAEVGLAALNAGKHVYGEKPLAVDVGEGRQLIETANAKGLRVGCAPDTFLGGSHQCARAALDQGRIGKPFAGTAFLMLAGHERWHPNPDFYYVREGGGPMFDMGPYYLTDLVNLLGPIAKASAFGTIARAP
ncbi:MAG: Gfo/Idh/MocA family oxidoreductase, partial [Pseudomonadota bacterium]